VNAGRIALVDSAGQLLGGIALVLIGLGLSIACALVSSEFDFYGYMGNCGAAAVDAVSRSTDPLAQHCQHIGIFYVAVGVLLGALIVLGGLLVLLDGIAPNHKAGMRPSSKRLVISSLCAVGVVLLAVTIAGTAAYSSGSRTPTQAVENDDGFGPPSVPG
jgi:hypothetical protein